MIWHRSHPRFDCLPTAATLDTLTREAMDQELFELGSEVSEGMGWARMRCVAGPLLTD